MRKSTWQLTRGTLLHSKAAVFARMTRELPATRATVGCMSKDSGQTESRGLPSSLVVL